MDGLIYKLDEDSFSIILNYLLDRKPILIMGNNEKEIEYFANALADLMVFRNKILFYTDFITTEEYIQIVEEEESDYDIRRSTIICPAEALPKAINGNFSHFKSWIFCYKTEKNGKNVTGEIFGDKTDFILNKLGKKCKPLLVIEKKKDSISVTPLWDEIKISKLKFERRVYTKAIKSIDVSITRMKRIFNQRLIGRSISNELKENILDFGFEELNLKTNMFKIQILEFYNACRRVFSILNKIALLQALNLNIEINSKTLMNTVSYDEAPFDRIKDFIKAEWGDILTEGISETTEYKHDLIESLWG